MPFDVDLKEVYESFLVPILTEVGFEVSRADDILSQENILRSIVEAIAACDLVVADLTGLNANVFYELGLAHGLRKPVVLLAQNIDDVPFDLKSYRVLVYDTHFARIGRSEEQLRNTAQGALSGSIEFGSPVSDFLPTSAQPHPGDLSKSPKQAASAVVAEEGRGLMDHMAAVEESMPAIARTFEKITASNQLITEITQKYTGRIQNAIASTEPNRGSRLRFIAGEYARELSAFSSRMSDANDEYELAASNIQNSLEAMLAQTRLGDETDRKAAEDLLGAIRSAHESAVGARAAFSSSRETLRGLENIEKRLTVAVRATGREVDRLIGNIDQTIASFERGLEVGSRRLGITPPEKHGA